MLRKGQSYGPEIGLLEALGITGVKVVRRPVVGLLSTGDEVAPVDTPVLARVVRDANGLPGLSSDSDRSPGSRSEILPDRYKDLYVGVQSLLEKVDMLVLSEGSVGEGLSLES